MRYPPYFYDHEQETHPERLWAISNSPDPAAWIVLDVGCGTHKTLPAMIGVDVRPVSDRVGSMEKLPFADSTVRAVVSRHSFEHALDSILVLQEWKRALVPEGCATIVLPDAEAIPVMDPFYSSNEHMHAFSQSSFRNLIEATGMFRVIKLEVVVEDWSFGAVLVPR